MRNSSVHASIALALLAPLAQAATQSNVTLDSARRALANGDAIAAVPMYEALAQQGESLEAELGLVRAALHAGQFRKAMSWATLTAGEHKDSVEAIALLAYLHDRIGHTDEALRSLKQLRAAQPQSALAVAAYADILIDRLAANQARSLISNWSAANPGRRTGDLERLLTRAGIADGLNAATNIPAGTRSADGPLAWPQPSFEAFPAAGRKIVGAGNGIVVDHGRQVLTYQGLFPKDASAIYVRNGLGKIRRAERNSTGGERGGLIRLRLSEAYPAEWSLPQADVVPPEGTRFCFALGYAVPASADAAFPAVIPGVVFRANIEIGGMMQVTSALGPGHAGVPIFDPRGHLLGISVGAGDIMLAGHTVRERVGAGHFAIRATGPASAKKQTAAPPPATPMPPMPSIEELYERLAPAVVQIILIE